MVTDGETVIIPSTTLVTVLSDCFSISTSKTYLAGASKALV
jgi:hypothetical protein